MVSTDSVIAIENGFCVAARLRVGQVVHSYTGMTKVVASMPTVFKPTLLATKSFDIITAPFQQILASSGWRAIGDLSVGEIVLTTVGPERIITISPLPFNCEMRIIDTENGCFQANGFHLVNFKQK